MSYPARHHAGTRRRVLSFIGAGALTVPVSAVGPAVAFADPDPHIGWASRVDEILAELKRLPPKEDVLSPCWNEVFALEDRIAVTPTTTAAGMREQVRLLLRYEEDGAAEETAEIRLLRNLRDGLERLAGRT